MRGRQSTPSVPEWDYNRSSEQIAKISADVVQMRKQMAPSASLFSAVNAQELLFEAGWKPGAGGPVDELIVEAADALAGSSRMTRNSKVELLADFMRAPRSSPEFYERAAAMYG